METEQKVTALAQAMEATGFAQAKAADMQMILQAQGLADWAGFAASWDDLGLDGFMADGGRYRRRRFAAFAAGPDGIRRKPHQPHYQSRDYNALNGGIARWFDPVTDAVAAHPATTAVLRMCHGLFTRLTAPDRRPEHWHVEMHQFRIEAQAGAEGRPTPEGLHRDGVDWVLVLLVRRENVAEGETSITSLDKTLMSRFTLAEPMDAALVDDGRVFHGVTAVHPLDPEKPAFRDVLVITFRHE
ncbi:2OG-Fe dioxygenase family protein [Acidisoma silvae]|uniref:2OG-Fe dioxygenase family protein n=1 Tax=Acidisoma silvae TaxID=2802396 RepID=A0A963YSI7_9PROT|nr:2OG-Fe dioxygenase family protein [Acidisoma silvae]MCB8875630.1 2OG-Fe dioxygenase family protein [Acidisoma silvae]